MKYIDYFFGRGFDFRVFHSRILFIRGQVEVSLNHFGGVNYIKAGGIVMKTIEELRLFINDNSTM